MNPRNINIIKLGALVGIILSVTIYRISDVSAQQAANVWTTYTYSNHIRDLAVDPTTGQVWAATSGGAVRWDPNLDTYVRYTAADGLINTNLYTVAVDRNGDKWLGTEFSGVSRLAADGTWTSFSYDAEHTPNDIVVDAQNNKWFATLSGVIRLAPNDIQTLFTTDHGLGSNDVTALATAPDGTIWAGTKGGGISHYPVNNRWETFATLTTTEGLPFSIITVTALAVDTHNNVWLSTADGLMVRKADGSGQKFDMNAGMPSNQVLGLYADNAGGVWVAYEKQAIYIMDTVIKTAIQYPPGLTANIGFPWHVAVVVDRDGNPWFGNFYGPWLARRGPNDTWTQYTTGDSLLDSFVGAVAVDNNHNKWFGTLNGINRLTANGEWSSYLGSGVRDIALDAAGNVWFATENGVREYTTAGQWQDYKKTANELIGNDVKAVYIDSHQNKWFGTATGVSRFSDTGQWYNYTTALGLVSNDINDITGDADGGIWFATNGSGVSRLTNINQLSNQGQWQPYTKSDGLASNYVRSLAVDNDGTVWFGADYAQNPDENGNVSRLAKNGAWTTDMFPDVGPSSISTIVIDKEGNRWFTVNGIGLIRLTPDNTQTRFTPKDGLASDRTLDIAFDSNGDLWVGTVSGVTSLTHPATGDTCQTAFSLQTGADPFGQLTDKADKDIYRIDVTSKFSRIEVTLTSTQTDDLELDLYRSCDTIGTARHSGIGGYSGNDLRLSLDTAGQPGTYYLEVSPKRGNAPFPLAYHLHVGLTVDEPNNQSVVRTLILTNYERIQQLFPSANVAALKNRLATLAQDVNVKGEIVDVRQANDLTITQAYNAWSTAVDHKAANQTAVANEFAQALADWLSQRKAQLPYLRYVVLVGDDRVIPHLRLPISAQGGGGWVNESAYLADLGPNDIDVNSSIGKALKDNQTLTDDIYGATDAQQWDGGRLYVPTLAVGRLVEQPADMVTAIDSFLAVSGTLVLTESLGAGYDFMQDAVEQGNEALNAAGLDDAHRTSLLGSGWTANELKNSLFNARYGLAFLAVHANHDRMEAPDKNSVQAIDIPNDNGTLAGKLIYAVACHAGLNVPGVNHGLPLDFAESWLHKGVTFVGSTGWAYGLDGTLAYQEVLMTDFTQVLLAGGGTAIGDALVQAKQHYYLSHDMNHFHVKTLAGTILYGLPMYRVQAPNAVARSASAGSVASETHPPQYYSIEDVSHATQQIDLNLFRESINFTLPIDALTFTTTTFGDYYSFSGERPYAEANTTVQPKLLFKLNEVRVGNTILQPHGVVFLGGQYHSEPGFRPLIEKAAFADRLYASESSLMNAAAPQPQSNLQPSLPVAMQWLPESLNTGSILFGGEAAQLHVYAGQYDAQSQVERLFEDLTLDRYYSSLPDYDAPVINSLSLENEGATTKLRVVTIDSSGIYTVVVAYTNGQGKWESAPLVPTGQEDTWQGEFIAPDPIILQIVDRAGNVAVQVVEQKSLFLPLIWGH